MYYKSKLFNFFYWKPLQNLRQVQGLRLPCLQPWAPWPSSAQRSPS